MAKSFLGKISLLLALIVIFIMPARAGLNNNNADSSLPNTSHAEYLTPSASNIDSGESERRFLFYQMSPAEVLVLPEQRAGFGPTAFELAIRGSLVSFEDTGLFQERRRRLRKYFGFSEAFPYLDNTERRYLSQMIEAGGKLVHYMHPHFLMNSHIFYDAALRQFTAAASRYLWHRVKGIRAHFETGNAHLLYSSVENFERHKDKQLTAIKSYYQQPEVRNIYKIIKRLAPELTGSELSSSFEELLLEPSNSFEGHHSQFVPPPALAAILQGLRALDHCSSWMQAKEEQKDTMIKLSESRQALHNAITSLANIKYFLNIYEYFKILSLVEQIAQPLSDISARNQRHITQPLLDISAWDQWQCEFWCNQLAELSKKIGMFIQYDYLDINKNGKEQQRKILASGSASWEEQLNAQRYLQHYAIQWLKLKRLGLLAYQAEKFERSFHTEILLDAAAELIPEIKAKALPAIEEWIKYELAVAKNKYDEPNRFDLKQETPVTPILSLLSAYASDVAYLTKLQETMDAIINVDSLPPEAIMRVITILGECAKNLSMFVKSSFGEKLWSNLATMRDDLHHSRRQKIVRDRVEDEAFAALLLKDFKTIGAKVNAQFKALPTTWAEIKTKYEAPKRAKATDQLRGIAQLFDLLYPDFDPKDYNTLIKTKASRVTKLQEHRDKVQNALQDVAAAKKITRTGFEDHLNQLTLLSRNEKNKILEFYKKLGQGGRNLHLRQVAIKALKGINQQGIDPKSQAELKQLQDILENNINGNNIPQASWHDLISRVCSQGETQKNILRGIEAIYDPDKIKVEEEKEFATCIKILSQDGFKPLSDSGWDKAVEDLIKRLKSISEKELVSELNRLEIKDQTPWEIIRSKINNKKPKNTTKEPSPQERMQQKLQKSQQDVQRLMEHLAALDKLTAKPQEPLGRTNLTEFWHNPKEYLSAEYHVEMIRHYAGVVEEAAQYLINYAIRSPYAKELNYFFHILSLKLQQIISGGNYFAHLHDVGEYETLAPHGVRGSLFGLIQHSASLKEYINLLSTLKVNDAATQAQAMPSSSTSNIINTYNVEFRDQPLRLDEREILPDGDCGFTGLGLTRTAAINNLIRQLHNPEVAEMVFDDLQEAFRGHDLPPALMARVQHLANQIYDQEEALDNILRALNDHYIGEHGRLSADEMLEELGRREDPESREKRELLLKTQQQIAALYQEVWRQLNTPEVIAEFLREEFLRSSRYLTYVRGSRGTLYALAHINNLEVHIWTHNGTPGNLTETFTVPARGNGPTSVIHLHHTNYGHELNHFNWLTIGPQPFTIVRATNVTQTEPNFEAPPEHIYLPSISPTGMNAFSSFKE